MGAGVLSAVGLMSGTSRDGVDAAIVHTDGRREVNPGPSLTLAYTAGTRERLGDASRAASAMEEVEREITLIHADAVARLLDKAGLAPDGVDIVGMHGHTILHAPERRITRQIGNPRLLARRLGIDVIADFRKADVEAGGEGAPLAPVYHAARAAGLVRPLAVLNLGGVANVTWIGHEDDDLIAFDTGPGNALIDDWTRARAGFDYDAEGRLAASGTVDEAALAELLDTAFFDRTPPKSLDRDAFDASPADRLDVADGAATLTAFTAAAVARALVHLPTPPRRWLVTGGGRKNPVLLTMLVERLGAPVQPVEHVGWNGDSLEAEAFAYMAVRSLAGLPITFPGTTGVPAPLTGGRLHRGRARP